MFYSTGGRGAVEEDFEGGSHATARPGCNAVVYLGLGCVQIVSVEEGAAGGSLVEPLAQRQEIEDRNKIFLEAIDIIFEIWKRNPPYEIDLLDNRFKVSTARTQAAHLGLGYLHKPLQTPCPKILRTVLAPLSKGVIAMGRRDFHPLSANFLPSKWLKPYWQNYAEGKASVAAKARTSDWRVARTIFAADDDKVTARYGRFDERSPYRSYYQQIQAKLTRSEIVYAGMDWVAPALAKRAM